MPLEISTDLCDRCGTCISVCPCNALLLTEQLTVDTQKCTMCGSCVRICPVAALTINKATQNG